MKLIAERALEARINRALPPGQSLHKSRTGQFYIARVEPIEDLETFARSLGVLYSDEELKPQW